jgi:integrase
MAKMEKTRHKGVYRRGSRYVATYWVDGKLRKESAPTLQAAKAIKDARTTDARRGEFHEQTRVTLQEYGAEWVERYQGTGKGFRESTREDYRTDLERAYRYFGSKRLGQITPRDVANFVGWLCDEQKQGRRLADATVRRIVAPLRACLRTAVNEGLIRSNPARDVSFPHREKAEAEEDEQARAFSRKQLVTFLKLVSPRHRLMFRFLAATGLRIGELIALQWRHLQLDQGKPEVRIRRQLYRGRFQPPKSKHGKRTIPIDPKLASELRKLRMATNPDTDDLVFPTTTGTPLSGGNLQRRVIQPIADKVGAPWATPHSFRHTCASLLFDQGRSAVQVQRWLGHHSPAFTLNTYVHLLPGDVVEPLALDSELRDVATDVVMPLAMNGTAEDVTCRPLSQPNTPELASLEAISDAT